MEESEKPIGKKKLPLIPSNYVSIRQLQERWIKEEERKQKEKEEKEKEKEESLHDQGEKEKLADEVADGGRSRRKGRFRRYDRENGELLVEAKLKEEDIGVGFAVKESEDVDEGEELKNEGKKKKKKKKKKWNKNKRNEKEEKVGEDNGAEEEVGTAVREPLLASVENYNGEKEVIGDDVHAPKQASVEEENVEARRAWKPKIIPRTEDRTVEIGRKFKAMSMTGEVRRGGYRYGRQNGNFNHHGGHRELNGRYHYGKFDRHREKNQRNEGMVWVKKGEVIDANVGGTQSSSCSSKELD